MAWRDAIDNAAPFTRAAKMAAEESEVLKGRTLIGRTGIRNHSDTELLTLSGLKQITAAIALGIHRRAGGNAQKGWQSTGKQEELKDKVVRFFDRFLPECQPNYRLLADTKSIGQNIIFERSGICSYDTPTLNLIANLHARWIERQGDEARLAEFAGRLELSKSAPENWLSKHGAYDPSKETYAPANRRAIWEKAASAILEEATAAAA